MIKFLVHDCLAVREDFRGPKRVNRRTGGGTEEVEGRKLGDASNTNFRHEGPKLLCICGVLFFSQLFELTGLD